MIYYIPIYFIVFFIYFQILSSRKKFVQDLSLKEKVTIEDERLLQVFLIGEYMFLISVIIITYNLFLQ